MPAIRHFGVKHREAMSFGSCSFYQHSKPHLDSVEKLDFEVKALVGFEDAVQETAAQNWFVDLLDFEPEQGWLEEW